MSYLVTYECPACATEYALRSQKPRASAAKHVGVLDLRSDDDIQDWLPRNGS